MVLATPVEAQFTGSWYLAPEGGLLSEPHPVLLPLLGMSPPLAPSCPKAWACSTTYPWGQGYQLGVLASGLGLWLEHHAH